MTAPELVAVPADLLRSAVACLHAAPGEAAERAYRRLHAILAEHEAPDLFAPPPEPPAPTMAAGADWMPPEPMGATRTQRAAAAKVWPKTGSRRLRILHLVAAAGERGLHDYELERMTGLPHQSVSSSRHGLVQHGWLEPATHPNGAPLERRNAAGNACQVWRLTAGARTRLG